MQDNTHLGYLPSPITIESVILKRSYFRGSQRCLEFTDLLFLQFVIEKLLRLVVLQLPLLRSELFFGVLTRLLIGAFPIPQAVALTLLQTIKPRYIISGVNVYGT